jgi:hypothetical protein
MHGGGDGFLLVRGPEGRRAIRGQLRPGSLQTITLRTVNLLAVVRLLRVIRLL